MYYLHGIIWYDHSEWLIEMSVELAMAYFKACLPEAAEGNLELEMFCTWSKSINNWTPTSSTTCVYLDPMQHDCLDAYWFSFDVMVPLNCMEMLFWGSASIFSGGIQVNLKNCSQDNAFLGQESNMRSHR